MIRIIRERLLTAEEAAKDQIIREQIAEEFMQTVNCGNNMTTFSGKYVAPDNLQPGEVCIEDIAHGLSNCCRFAGQCKEFYSVAQHSMLVALNLREELRGRVSTGFVRKMCRIALLHDAPEAYCGDLVRCVKSLVGKSYDDLEYSIWMAVVIEFELEPLYSRLVNEEADIRKLPAPVKEADMRMLVTERKYLISEKSAVWDLQRIHEPYDIVIEPLPPKLAEAAFLQTYQELL